MKKYISWNVNGLRAVLNKGFMDFFLGEEPDAICLQETKIQAGQVTLDIPGYCQFYDYADKKGYAGTAIITRHEPRAVRLGFPDEEFNHEGRAVTLEYEDHFLVTAYVPNSQDGLKRLGYRMDWEDMLRDYLVSLDSKKPVIYCGDLNVAHQAIDLKNDKTNHMSAGFTDEERAKFSRLLHTGFTDTFRYLYPEKEEYSWWSYRMKARERNAGWRIDYFLISDRIRHLLRDAFICTGVYGSDHAPVGIGIDLNG